MRIPTIQIQQQYAKIGFDVDLGQYEIRQPGPTFEMQTIPAKLDIQSPPAKLTIDKTEALHAYGTGGPLKTMSFIYSQMHEIAIQGIARIVERGNRLTSITKEPDAIANIAREEMTRENPIQYVGQASFDNVGIHVEANKPQIEVIPGSVEIRTHPNPPEINYTRGKNGIFMQQYGKVTIIPPELDITI